MIYGIGTDIVQIPRMVENLEKHGNRFAQRILSESEFLEFSSNKNQAAFLAKRFAAKEATVKALGTGFTRGISMKDISIEHDALGKPVISLVDVARQIFQENKIQASHISIADEKEFAVAYVVLEK